MVVFRATGALLGVAGVLAISAGAAWAQEAGETNEPRAAGLTEQQLQILFGLGGLLALMLLVGAALIWSLQKQTRELAEANPELRERYAALPFGVPEGTVRGLVSILIIVFGLAVLVVQGPLQIASTEAVAGFISAVIAFYFVTREQAQTANAFRASMSALRQATCRIDRANENLTEITRATRGANPSSIRGFPEADRFEEFTISRNVLSAMVHRFTEEDLRNKKPDFNPDKKLGGNHPDNGMSENAVAGVVGRVQERVRISSVVGEFGKAIDIERAQIARQSMDGKWQDLAARIYAAILADLEAAKAPLVP